MDLLSGVFDISYLRKKGCEGINDSKKRFMKYLDPNFEKYNNFSYPRTEHWNPKSSFKNLARLIEKKIFPENYNNSRYSEVFVSFKDNNFIRCGK